MKDANGVELRVGDKIKFTEKRIQEFNGHPGYGVAPGQVYTVTGFLDTSISHTLYVENIPCNSRQESVIKIINRPLIVIGNKR